MSRPRRPKGGKVASLSGSLLERGARDPDAGFVLVSLDDKRAGSAEEPLPPPSEEAPSEEAPSEERLSEEAPPAGQLEEAAAPDGEAPEGGALEPTPQQVIEALRRGHRSRAEFVLAELAGVTRNQARHALFRDAGRQLAVICRALGVEQLQFASIFILSGRLGARRTPLRPQDLAEMTAYYAKTSPDRAAVLLRQWQSGRVAILGRSAGPEP